MGPGLSLDNPTKVQVLPPMLTEMINVVLEVDKRRLRGERLDNIGDTLEHYMVVLNDATPEWRMSDVEEHVVVALPPAGGTHGAAAGVVVAVAETEEQQREL